VQPLEASLAILQALEASFQLLEARLSISTDEIDVCFELSENLASNLCNVRDIKEDESLSLFDKVRQCKSRTALHILQDGWSDGKKRMARRIFFDPKTSLLTEEEHIERFRERRRNRKKKGGNNNNNNNNKGKAVKSKKANTSTNQPQQPVVIAATSSELVASSRVVESLPPPPPPQQQQTPSAASVVEDVVVDTAVVVASPIDDDTTFTVVESANVVLPPDVDDANETAVFFVKSVSDGVVCEYAHCRDMSVGELKEKVAVNMSVQVESIQLSIESIGMVSTSSIDKDDATLEHYSIYPFRTLRVQCVDDVIGLKGGARTSSRQSSGSRGGRGRGSGRGRGQGRGRVAAGRGGGKKRVHTRVGYFNIVIIVFIQSHYCFFFHCTILIDRIVKWEWWQR